MPPRPSSRSTRYWPTSAPMSAGPGSRCATGPSYPAADPARLRERGAHDPALVDVGVEDVPGQAEVRAQRLAQGAQRLGERHVAAGAALAALRLDVRRVVVAAAGLEAADDAGGEAAADEHGRVVAAPVVAPRRAQLLERAAE